VDGLTVDKVAPEEFLSHQDVLEDVRTPAHAWVSRRVDPCRWPARPGGRVLLDRHRPRPRQGDELAGTTE
jgi:hypothetical protein